MDVEPLALDAAPPALDAQPLALDVKPNCQQKKPIANEATGFSSMNFYCCPYPHERSQFQDIFVMHTDTSMRHVLPDG